MRWVNSIWVALLSLGLIVGLSGCSGEEKEVVLSPEAEKQVVERLQPEGDVNVEGQAPVEEVIAGEEVATAPPIEAAASNARTGEDIYNKSCTTCHSTGAANAPKPGDQAAWEARMAQGMETVYANAINGVRAMPPRGLCMDCSDDEVKLAVDYMLK